MEPRDGFRVCEEATNFVWGNTGFGGQDHTAYRAQKRRSRKGYMCCFVGSHRSGGMLRATRPEANQPRFAATTRPATTRPATARPRVPARVHTRARVSLPWRGVASVRTAQHVVARSPARGSAQPWAKRLDAASGAASKGRLRSAVFRVKRFGDARQPKGSGCGLRGTLQLSHNFRYCDILSHLRSASAHCVEALRVVR